MQTPLTSPPSSLSDIPITRTTSFLQLNQSHLIGTNTKKKNIITPIPSISAMTRSTNTMNVQSRQSTLSKASSGNGAGNNSFHKCRYHTDDIDYNIEHDDDDMLDKNFNQQTHYSSLYLNNHDYGQSISLRRNNINSNRKNSTGKGKTIKTVDHYPSSHLRCDSVGDDNSSDSNSSTSTSNNNNDKHNLSPSKILPLSSPSSPASSSSMSTAANNNRLNAQQMKINNINNNFNNFNNINGDVNHTNNKNRQMCSSKNYH